MPSFRRIQEHEQQPQPPVGPDKRKRESNGSTATTADAILSEADEVQPSAKVGDTPIAPAAAKKPKTEKKSKPNKDPNAPKKAQSAWNCFQSEMWARLKSESTVSMGDSINIKTRMSEQWRQLRAEEKAKYDNLAEMDKKRYKEEMRVYKKQSTGGMDGFVTKRHDADASKTCGADNSHTRMGNGMLIPTNDRGGKGISMVNVSISIDNEMKINSDEPRRVSTDSELGTAVDFSSKDVEPINSLGLSRCPARSSSKKVKVKQEKIKTEQLNTVVDNKRGKTNKSTRVSIEILSELDALKKTPKSVKLSSRSEDNASGVKSKPVSWAAGKSSANIEMKDAVDYKLCTKFGGINQPPKYSISTDNTIITSSKHEANDTDCNLYVKTEGMDLSVKDSVQMKLTGAKALSEHKKNFVKADKLGPLNFPANFAEHLDSSHKESSGIEDAASLGSKSLLSPFKTSKPKNDGTENAPHLTGIKPCKMDEKLTTSSSSYTDRTNEGKENATNVRELMTYTTSKKIRSRREGQIQFSLVPITPEECRRSLELRHLNVVNKYKLPEDEDPRMTIHLSSEKELIIGRNKSTGIKSELISRNLCTLSISDSPTTASISAILLVKRPQKMHGVHVDGEIVNESQKAVLLGGSILSLYGPYGYAYQVEVSRMNYHSAD